MESSWNMDDESWMKERKKRDETHSSLSADPCCLYNVISVMHSEWTIPFLISSDWVTRLILLSSTQTSPAIYFYSTNPLDYQQRLKIERYRITIQWYLLTKVTRKKWKVRSNKSLSVRFLLLSIIVQSKTWLPVFVFSINLISRFKIELEDRVQHKEFVEIVKHWDL